MYQEEENELDALQSAKELEEEKKRAKEQQAKMVNYNLLSSWDSACSCIIVLCLCNVLFQDDIALVICMIVIMLVTCAVVFVKVILISVQLRDYNGRSRYEFIFTEPKRPLIWPQHFTWPGYLILQSWNFDTQLEQHDRFDLVNYIQIKLKQKLVANLKHKVSSELSIKVSKKRNAVAYTVI